MTFNETYYEFDAEIERLESQIQDLREQLNDLDENSPQRPVIADELSSLQSQRQGVVWARDRAFENDDFPQWDEDVDGVTLGAIRAGTFGRLQDDVAGDPNAGGGTSTNLLVAEGTVVSPTDGEQAPYVDSGMPDSQQAAAVAQLHPYYREWAQARINDLLDPESGNATNSGSSHSETSPPETSTSE